MEFKTQIATTIEQSKKLLELGIKPETADMLLFRVKYKEGWSQWHPKPDAYSELGFYAIRQNSVEYLPAWSLHRLLRLASYDMEINIFLSRRCFKIFNHKPVRADSDGALYDGLIDYIEWTIKEGYFPKEFLENPLTIEDVLEQSRRQGRTTIRVIPKGKEE